MTSDGVTKVTRVEETAEVRRRECLMDYSLEKKPHSLLTHKEHKNRGRVVGVHHT